MTEPRTGPASPAGGSPERGRGHASGGVAAQFTQAGASFVLQFLAVRVLGVEGLGLFISLYALIVLGAAVNSGFVGDSLTVLSRNEPRIRAGLQAWGLMIPAIFGLVLALVAGAADFVTGWLVIAVGTGALVFLVEDVLRRVLMATLHFWRIVVVDLIGLTGAVVTLSIILTTSTLEVGHFFLALTIGQTCALLTAMLLLPRGERRWAPLRRADLGAVFAYGSWRALLQSIKPALLALVRIFGVAIVSAAAVGQLEAARIYLSPVLILIGGLSTVMMARYASRRTDSLNALVRSADRSAWWIVLTSTGCLLAALLGRPLLAPFFTRGEFELPVLALVGWATYAAATGYAAPYSTLAAVRGSQRTVVGVRLVESVTAGCIVLAIFLVSNEVLWAPLVLGAGSAIGGFWLRAILKRQSHERLT